MRFAIFVLLFVAGTAFSDGQARCDLLSASLAGVPVEEIERLLPQNAKLLPQVEIAYNIDQRVHRDILVISVDELTESERNFLINSDLGVLNAPTISIAIKQTPENWGGHARVRIGKNVFDFEAKAKDEGKFNVNDFRLLRKGSRIEIPIKLSSEESERAKIYTALAAANRHAVLGKSSGPMGPGLSEVRRRLSDNRPFEGCHNCGTWFSMAPLGENGETLFELLGLERQQGIHSRMVRWMPFLIGGAPLERVPLLIYWTVKPLSEVVDVLSHKDFIWNIQEGDGKFHFAVEE